MKFCFAIVLLFFSHNAFAQKPDVIRHSIKGIVTDKEGQALSDAIISLQNIGNSVNMAIQSDTAGTFHFNDISIGKYTVSVTMIGFEPFPKIRLEVKEADSVINLGNIILKASALKLQEVIVKSQTPAIQRLLDKTVVNIDNNTTYAGTTVLDVLRKTPGIQVGQDGQLLLNGKSGVNVLINGKPTYLSTEDLAALLNSMQSSSVQKIEIMANPPAKYDANGAAVINIMKKKNRKEGFNGSVNATVRQGYYGDYNGGFTLSYKNKWYNLDFNNSYTLDKKYFYRTVTSEILNNNQQLLKEQVSGNSNIEMNRSYLPSLGLDFYVSRKTTLSLNANIVTLSTKNMTFATMDIFNGSRVKTSKEDFSGINKATPLNYTSGIHLEQQIDTIGKLISFDIDYSNYENKPRQFNTTLTKDTSGQPTGVTNVFLSQYRKLNIYVAKADYVHPLKNKGQIEAGIKSSYVKVLNENSFYNVMNGQSKIDSSHSNYTINTENINAAYLNYNRDYTKISMQLGLRAEQTVMQGKEIVSGQKLERNYFQLFPTLFLSYKLSDKNSVLLRLGRRIERASYSEMVPFRRPLTPTLYFQGNPNLQPQTSSHAEAGWILNSALSVTFSYDAYHNYIRTLPYLDSNQTTTTRIPTNIPGVHVWNIDIGYTKKVLKWWSLNYDLQVYQNYFNGSLNNFSINNNGVASLQLNANNDFTLNNKLSIACNFEYNSKREFATTSYGAYSVLNIGMKYQILQGKGTLSLNGNNLLQSEDDYAIDRYENLNQYSYRNYYTRSVRLNFVYRFGSGKANKINKGTGSVEEQRRARN